MDDTPFLMMQIGLCLTETQKLCQSSKSTAGTRHGA